MAVTHSGGEEMATKTQFFCDKCGAESRSKPQAVWLMRQVAEFGGTDRASSECDLCQNCFVELQDLLIAWGMTMHGRPKIIPKSAKGS
jgi:hypothetical protein